MSLKIGLLLPRSVLYPAINFDILEGVREGLATAGCTAPSIVTENIGVGTNDPVIYAHCEKMLFDGIRIVAGYVNPATATKLQPLFAAAGAVFIALDSGLHFSEEREPLPNVLNVSLQSALCCKAVTQQALDAGYRTFSFVTSFFDAGYRSAYAIARTLTHNKAEVVFNHVTALRRTDFTLEPLIRFHEQEAGHAIAAAFCGDMAVDFLAHIAGHDIPEGSLYGGPFMGDEVWLGEFTYPGTDVTVCVPWCSRLGNEQNRAFVAALEQKGRKANFFSLLGYEAGLLAAAIDQGGLGGAQAVQALLGYVFESPRGTVRLDAATRQTVAPVSLIALVEGAEGKCDYVLSDTRPDTEHQWALLQEDIAAFSGLSNNWLNTYPCLES